MGTRSRVAPITSVTGQVRTESMGVYPPDKVLAPFRPPTRTRGKQPPPKPPEVVATSDPEPEQPEELEPVDLSSLTVKDLKALAESEGVSLGDASRKAEIIEVLTDAGLGA
jgi:hypothetical protein